MLILVILEGQGVIDKSKIILSHSSVFQAVLSEIIEASLWLFYSEVKWLNLSQTIQIAKQPLRLFNAIKLVLYVEIRYRESLSKFHTVREKLLIWVSTWRDMSWNFYAETPTTNYGTFFTRRRHTSFLDKICFLIKSVFTSRDKRRSWQETTFHITRSKKR